MEKAGWTFRKLAKAHEKCHSYFSDTLVRPNPNAQRILAEIIGKPATTIWPSRYEEDGTPKRGLYAGSHENGRDYLTRSVRSVSASRNGKNTGKNNQRTAA